jgi:hypothetical protein
MQSHPFGKQLMQKSRNTCTHEKRIQHLNAYLFKNIFILKLENLNGRKHQNPGKE